MEFDQVIICQNLTKLAQDKIWSRRSSPKFGPVSSYKNLIELAWAKIRSRQTRSKARPKVNRVDPVRRSAKLVLI